MGDTNTSDADTEISGYKSLLAQTHLATFNKFLHYPQNY